MRKLLASVIGAVMALVLPAIALAAIDEDEGLSTPRAVNAPLSAGEQDELRRDAKRALRPKKRKRKQVEVPAQLQAIAQCESHGDPRAIGGGGAYRGKYQFSRSTWNGVGGKGDPAEASEAEQDRRALILYERSGAGQWPVCGS